MRLARVSQPLGDLEPFLPKGAALGERAEFGMAPSERGTGEHGRQKDLPKRSWRRAPSSDTTVCRGQSNGPTRVALGVVDYPEELVASACSTTSPLAVARREARAGRRRRPGHTRPE